MMACSYLSAGGMKSEPTSAACWSPPALPAFAADTRQTMTQLPSSITLPTGPAVLPSGPIGLASPAGLTKAPIGLLNGPIGPSASITLPHGALTIPRGLPSRSAVSGSVGLPRSAGLPNSQLGLPNLSVELTNTQLVLHSDPLRPPSRSGITSGSAALPPLGISTGSMLLPNAQKGLPPPFARPTPLDLHSPLSQSGTTTEPALDLSTSASMTSSVKSRLASPDEATM